MRSGVHLFDFFHYFCQSLWYILHQESPWYQECRISSQTHALTASSDAETGRGDSPVPSLAHTSVTSSRSYMQVSIWKTQQGAKLDIQQRFSGSLSTAENETPPSHAFSLPPSWAFLGSYLLSLPPTSPWAKKVEKRINPWTAHGVVFTFLLLICLFRFFSNF